MPAELHHLTDGWLELESDPGLFTLLVEDFGCKGVQVEEIYDLQRPSLVDGPVYGFIFLFKWIEERRSRTRDRYNPTYSLSSSSNTVSSDQSSNSATQPVYIEDETVVNSLFYAHQIIPNSCATHALLSVLLNCPTVELGSILARIKEHTVEMTPENKGLAIGNAPELAKVHNAHASVHDVPDIGTGEKISAGTTARSLNQRSGGITQESFHFVSYVPINGRLYELDGLKRRPIDHGPVEESEDWTEKFKRIITQRIAQEQNSHNSDGSLHDIRYNLMAVVPDRRVAYVNKLNTLRSNRHIVLEALECMMRPTRLPGPFDYHNYSKYPTSMSYAEGPAPPSVVEASETQNPIEKPLTVDTSAGQNMSSTSTYTNASLLTTPLSIQTNVSPALSSSSSTDTCSDASSAFNSPNPGGSKSSMITVNPNERCDKFFVVRVSSNNSASVATAEAEKSALNSVAETVTNGTNGQVTPGATNSLPEGPVTNSPHFPHGLSNLTPRTKAKAEKISKNMNGVRDIVRLLKALEEEIESVEANLKEELEKRQKYRVDDSRRTHNYDEFITTFLLMLAEQGKLPDLLEKSLSINGTAAVTTATNGYEDNSPQSPSAFFAELQTAYEDLSTDDASSPIKKSANSSSPGLAEFLNKMTGQTNGNGTEKIKTPSPVRAAAQGSKNSRSVSALVAAKKRKRKKASPAARLRYKRNRMKD